ncbi:MAG: P-loop NTPase [Candidatus Woesearchaeota archaeon]
MTYILAVASAKGGVGKTTTAINLTSALIEFGRHAILVDGCLQKPNIGLYLGIQTQKTMHSALRGVHSVSESIVRHASGIPVIIGKLNSKQSFTKTHVSEALTELLTKTELVIVDTPPTLEPSTQDVLYSCDGVLLITSQDILSVTDTLKTAQFARAHGKQILGVVVTHTYKQDTDITLQSIAATLDTQVVAEIPYDRKLHDSLKKRHPILYIDDGAPSAIAYKKLAANLIGQTYEPSISKKNFLQFILQHFYRK